MQEIKAGRTPSTSSGNRVYNHCHLQQLRRSCRCPKLRCSSCNQYIMTDKEHLTGKSSMDNQATSGHTNDHGAGQRKRNQGQNKDLYRSDSESPESRNGQRKGGQWFAATHPSDRTQPAAQHLLATAASSNASLSFLQQAGPADICHCTGRQRELSRFCPSAQLSGRSQLCESCISSQKLPKVIFFYSP